MFLYELTYKLSVKKLDSKAVSVVSSYLYCFGEILTTGQLIIVSLLCLPMVVGANVYIAINVRISQLYITSFFNKNGQIHVCTL
jgi:hypothetical protein